MPHTDQGWQYQMIASQNWLWAAGVVQSMSRKGCCLDNAMAESLIGMLKSECFCLEEFSGIPALSFAIDAYIYDYNHERIYLGQAVRENPDVSAGKKKATSEVAFEGLARISSGNDPQTKRKGRFFRCCPLRFMQRTQMGYDGVTISC